ncbi:MAG TPA: hypothetical protein VGI74_22985 [Streptosporangiaceae bacterium]
MSELATDWGAPQGFAVFGADETVRMPVPAPPGAHWTEFGRGRHFPVTEARPCWRRACGPSSGRCDRQRLPKVSGWSSWAYFR